MATSIIPGPELSSYYNAVTEYTNWFYGLIIPGWGIVVPLSTNRPMKVLSAAVYNRNSGWINLSTIAVGSNNPSLPATVNCVSNSGNSQYFLQFNMSSVNLPGFEPILVSIKYQYIS